MGRPDESGNGQSGHRPHGGSGGERSPWAAPGPGPAAPGEQPGAEGPTAPPGPSAGGRRPGPDGPPAPAARQAPADQQAAPGTGAGHRAAVPTAGEPQPAYPAPGHPPPGYASGAYPPAGHPGSPYPGPPLPPSPVAAAPPPRRSHRWGLGAYLVVEAVFLLASFLVAAALADQLSSSAGALAVALAAPTLLAAGTALLITWWRGNGPRIDLGLTFSWRDVGIGLAFGFGGLVITIPASLLYVAIAGDETTSAVGQGFAGIRSGPWLAALVFVIVVVVAPLCEEIVYRGLLWGAVERLGANRWWAAAITTVVFALAHFEFSRTPLLLVVAVPIALARLYTGRLAAPIVAHSVNNLLPAVSLVLMLLGVLPGT